MGQSPPINRTLAQIEVDLVLAGAARDQQPIMAPYEANLIARRLPDCGMTAEEIAREIMARATERGLRVADQATVDSTAPASGPSPRAPAGA